MKGEVMKKILIGVIIVILILGTISGILSLRNDGYKLEKQKPAVFYFLNDSFTRDVNQEELQASSERQYVDIEFLKQGPVTWQYYDSESILSITDWSHNIEISVQGQVWIDGVLSPHQVELKQIKNKMYLSLTDLNAFKEGEMLGVYSLSSEDHQVMGYFNKHLSYPRYQIPLSKKVYQTARDLKVSEEWKEGFLGLHSLFHKRTFVGETEGEAFVFKDQKSGASFYVSDSMLYGYTTAEGLVEQSQTATLEAPAGMVDYHTAERVVLAWEAVYGLNPDTSKIPAMPGLNVIAPTWIELKSEQGDVVNLSSADYVAWAKERGYGVWITATNKFDIDLTRLFFQQREGQKKYIQILINECQRLNVEGINIDFEHIYKNDRDALSHFIANLGLACRENGIILSMDVNVPGGSDNWSQCYDHATLGHLVDYLVIMTYDEFYESSPVSGPVASYDWVAGHMTALSKIVYPRKLVMGVPFYTRVWRERPDPSAPNNPNKKKVSSEAIPITAQTGFLGRHAIKPEWDDVEKLYFGTYFEGEEQVKIWIENVDSIAAKVSLVRHLSLGGVAAWQRGYETQDIWPVFSDIQ